MADYKKQHYVPRSYLKRFSLDGVHIGMCLVDSRQIFQPDYKNECYENYFYGNDINIEGTLSKIEKAAAAVFDKIVINGNISGLTNKQICDMLVYIVLQNTRTLGFAEQLNDSTNKTMKMLLPHMGLPAPPAPMTFDDIKFSYQKPAIMGARLGLELAVHIHDLHYALLRTSRDCEFITCDAPVALCNQFLGGIPRYKSFGFPKTGLTAKGLQIYFPIDPLNLLMLYDGDVYDVKVNARGMKHVSADDVTGINLLIMKAAEHKIFFSKHIPSLENVLKKFKHPGREKAVVEKCNVKFADTGESGEIIRIASNEMHYAPMLSFVAMTRHAKCFRRTVESGIQMRKSDFLRDYEYMRALRCINEEIAKGGPYQAEALAILDSMDA